MKLAVIKMKVLEWIEHVVGMDQGWAVKKVFEIKGKGLPQQAEVAQGVLGRLRPWIFLTFGTMRVVGRQPYTLAKSSLIKST
jgi:hypothetical protein